MAPKSLPPKTTQQKRPAVSQHCGNGTDDPGYAVLRLQGLARLIYCASTTTIDLNPIDQEAAFFISTELRDLASRLLNESRS